MNFKIPIQRELIWLGDSRKKIRSFPEEVQKDMGDELQLIQFGKKPKDTKPFRGCGAGVLEIVKDFDKDAYRALVAVKVGERIYVLDVFKKKSKKGRETPRQDVDRIKMRLKEAKELENDKEN